MAERMMSSPSAESPEKDCGLHLISCSSEALSQRIVSLAEFYLSDEQILREHFLLTQVRRNRLGYVSIKLLTSYRKMRGLSKDWQVVREALRLSTVLEVNAEGTKVRRHKPLPEHDKIVPSRTVVVYPLDDRIAAEAVAETFSQCGRIAVLRMLIPGAPVSPYAELFLQRHPEVRACSAAMVSYESRTAASKAHRLANPALLVVPITDHYARPKTRDNQACRPQEK